MKEIKITEIENIRIGSAENKEAGTGCTVIICERGAAAGLDVRGGGPASRESELLKPMAAADLCTQGFILSTTLDYFDEMGLYAFSSAINLILIVTILIFNTLVNKLTGASLDDGIGGN